MFLDKLLNRVTSAVNRIKSFFIEPKKVKQQEVGTELTKTRTIPERFREPEKRPAWVKGLFDDFIYGRVKSLDSLSKQIDLRLNQQFHRYCRK